jgi:hypothetical protein
LELEEAHIINLGVQAHMQQKADREIDRSREIIGSSANGKGTKNSSTDGSTTTKQDLQAEMR